MAASICRYFKYGHCKYQARCRNRHVESICEDSSCNLILCENRHPVICKFFSTFGRCKYNPCSYKHLEVSTGNTDGKMVLDIETNARDIDVLKNSVSTLSKNVEDLKSLLSASNRRITELESLVSSSQLIKSRPESLLSRTTLQKKEKCGASGSVFVREADNACCDHHHRLDGDIPPNGSCCYYRCRPAGRRKKT